MTNYYQSPSQTYFHLYLVFYKHSNKFCNFGLKLQHFHNTLSLSFHVTDIFPPLLGYWTQVKSKKLIFIPHFSLNTSTFIKSPLSIYIDYSLTYKLLLSSFQVIIFKIETIPYRIPMIYMNMVLYFCKLFLSHKYLLPEGVFNKFGTIFVKKLDLSPILALYVRKQYL